MNSSFDTPLVSVVIPVYNRVSTLERALRSVLMQCYDAIEVIVVDDGSTDGSQAVVQRVNDPRVQLVQHDKNRGVSAARNTGIERANGAFLAFQDSDDEWLAGKLSAQVDCMNAAGEDCVLVYCTKVVYGRDEGRNFGDRRVACVPPAGATDLSGDMRQALIHGTFISPQTMLMRTDAVRRMGGFDHRIYGSEEWDFCQRLAELGRFDFVDEPLVNTYIQNDSISAFNPRVNRSLLTIYNNMKRRGVAPSSLADPLARLGLTMVRNGSPRQGLRLLRYAMNARLCPAVASRWAVGEVLAKLTPGPGRLVAHNDAIPSSNIREIGREND